MPVGGARCLLIRLPVPCPSSLPQVQAFLHMAEQALKSRSAANEELSRALSETRSAAAAVQKTSSAAQEESSFLADSMQVRAAQPGSIEQASRPGLQLRWCLPGS